MLTRVLFPFSLVLAITLLSAGCRPQVTTRAEYQMGEKVPAGPLTYNVVEKVWRSQLGEMFQTRMPQNRFLVITVSATNGERQRSLRAAAPAGRAGWKIVHGTGKRRRGGQLVWYLENAGAGADRTGPHPFRRAVEQLSPAAIRRRFRFGAFFLCADSAANRRRSSAGIADIRQVAASAC